MIALNEVRADLTLAAAWCDILHPRIAGRPVYGHVFALRSGRTRVTPMVETGGAGLAEAERITTTVMVPAMYNLCLLEPAFADFDLSSWRVAGFGGAPMPPATIEKLARHVPSLVLQNAYGSTETSSPATLLPAGTISEHPESVGQPLPLADIVTVTSRTGFSTIRRENGLAVVSVTGDLSEDDPGRAEEIMTELREVILPAVASDFGIGWTLAGLAEQEGEFLTDAMTGFLLSILGIYLVLAWVFASWSRPLVVMAIIPFGLVGTIWGHNLWDVPLSMFTVVGLIGMTGIIINDSIVLVTTVDDYARDRGLIPAIVDGAADRLRPVLLTTLTTVLGLTPLLYEGSQQAQFLKPTVITLVYGLGFGLVIVLLVVPAILAMQQDAGKQVVALRRVLGGWRRAPGLAAAVGALGVGIAALFAVTLGAVAVTGQIAPALSSLLPAAAQGAQGALALFLAGSAVLCLVAWVAGAVAHGLARMRRAG